MKINFWIQIVGTKDTGKTSLIEGLTRELVRRGRSVCYIKHTHSEPSFDGGDTDTARMSAAGATTSVLAGAATTTSFRSSGDEGLEEVSFREAIPGAIVLAEGFKSVPGKKIAIAGGDLDIASLEGVVAVVGEAPEGFDGRAFQPAQIAEICDLIEELLATSPEQHWSTRLLIDGKELPLNTFVQDSMAMTLRGMCEPLRGGKANASIEIRCTLVREDAPSQEPEVD
jgi:molybdopterin-guanine dinucleotide biosynthesis protein B